MRVKTKIRALKRDGQKLDELVEAAKQKLASLEATLDTLRVSLSNVRGRASNVEDMVSAAVQRIDEVASDNAALHATHMAQVELIKERIDKLEALAKPATLEVSDGVAPEADV